MDIANIKCWFVYHVKSNETNPPKLKYAVIACIPKEPMGFLINSHITRWLERHPNLLVCDPIIPLSDHPFLKRDSYVDCQKLFQFHDWEIVKKAGPLSKQAKADILEAIHLCPDLSRQHKRMILRKEGYPGYNE